jgi:hypothetical protein
MSLHNLATVFGPTLLRPSEVESKAHLTSAADIWSHDVMAQVPPTLPTCINASLGHLQDPEEAAKLKPSSLLPRLEAFDMGVVAPGSPTLSRSAL